MSNKDTPPVKITRPKPDRRRRRVRFVARKRFTIGPYYRIYSLRDGVPTLTSHGIKIGRCTYNFTTRRWSFDTPGPGAIQGGGR